MSESVSTPSATTRLIPREIIFGNPEKANARLSPDGSQLAYIAPRDGVLNLWVGPSDGTDFRPITNDRDRGIRNCAWLYNGKHLVYVQDQAGNENWHLYVVNPETEEVYDATPFENVSVQLIDLSYERPDEVLVGINKDDPELHDVYRLTVSTGELELVEKNPGKIVDWEADLQLRIVSARRIADDGSQEILIRREGEWSVLRHVPFLDAWTSRTIGFSRDGSHIYLIDSVEANAARLIAIDVDSGEETVISASEKYDVHHVVRHPTKKHVELVAFEEDRLRWEIVDAAIREDFERASELDEGECVLFSRNLEDSLWLLAFSSPTSPGRIWKFDRTTREGEYLFSVRPKLEEYELAEMEPISFEARDGMRIHGYLSFPPGADRKNLPLVLNVHGGPWVRDSWGYDAEAQWLANRGYACLQINYRGSTGYGKEYLNAGNREWGRKMHYDLIDGVQAIVDQGIADPERVAIYGGSYGGYAALVGATMTPDVFKCAVAIVGPSNLVTFIKTIPPYWRPLLELFRQRVGDPETERDFLMSRSPITHVDNIRIPMLIAHGANDPRVVQAESEQIVAAMKERGLEHEYLLFEDEGHGFAKPENRERFYAAAERFLAEQLGGVLTTSATDSATAY